MNQEFSPVRHGMKTSRSVVLTCFFFLSLFALLLLACAALNQPEMERAALRLSCYLSSTLQLFHCSTPCLRIARCSGFATVA